jgi:hypothetical protein
MKTPAGSMAGDELLIPPVPKVLLQTVAPVMASKAVSFPRSPIT